MLSNIWELFLPKAGTHFEIRDIKTLYDEDREIKMTQIKMWCVRRSSNTSSDHIKAHSQIKMSPAGPDHLLGRLYHCTVLLFSLLFLYFLNIVTCLFVLVNVKSFSSFCLDLKTATINTNKCVNSSVFWFSCCLFAVCWDSYAPAEAHSRRWTRMCVKLSLLCKTAVKGGINNSFSSGSKLVVLLYI